MEGTLLMVTRGVAQFHSSDPFVRTVKQQPMIQSCGPHVILSDLLTFSLQKGI
jgi:hypothetical protein